MVSLTTFVRSNRQLQLHATFAVAAILLSSGCASIISGRKANVAIDSYPTNAHVVIHDKSGHEVASVMTPGVVALDRNGKWFLPARYTATIEAPGYQTAEVPIHSTINPWILGNVVVGGIPGLIVDDATGACWKPDRDAIHQQLAPAAYAQQPPAYPAGATAVPAACPVPSESANQTAMNSVTPAPQSAAGQPTAPTYIPAASAPANPEVARGPAVHTSGTFYR
jgi:hypothetical protein